MSATLIAETNDDLTIQITIKKFSSFVEMENSIKISLDSVKSLATTKAMKHIHKNNGLNLDLNFLNKLNISNKIK